MEKKLTKLQAYNAMIKFLEIYFVQSNSGDLGSLLGGMDFLVDGSTADSAAWEDWIDSVNAILKKNNEWLTQLQAFNAMREFLKIYHDQTHSNDVGSILSDSAILPNGNTVNPVAWTNWMKCIDAVLREEYKE